MMNRRLRAEVLAALALAIPTSAEAAQCGSALLLEVSAPAVFDGIDPDAPSVTRFWEAGAGGSNRSDAGCQAGCTIASGSGCASSGGCLALTGVNWLNASCATPGRLPLRTIFLMEQITTDTGGRWAAINLDRNAGDANTDLDAKAEAVCNSCASVVSPYLGGNGRPVVTGSSAAAGNLTVSLSWSQPSAFAQALSNGTDLVTSYGIYYRTHEGTPPPATGEPTGWARISDVDADGAANGGFSIDTTATVDIPLAGLLDNVTLAIGLSFDGSGNPTADGNTLISTFLSDDSEPVAVPTGCGEPNNLILENQTISGTQEFVGCFTITARNGFIVGATGDVTFRAGNSVTLAGGFSVATGGRFEVTIDPTLAE